MISSRALAVVLLLLTVGGAHAAEIPLKPFWQADEFEGVPEVEAALATLLNAERAKAKLPPLKLRPELVTAARQHTGEMFREDYFAHVSPHAAWRMPADRAYRCGYWEAYVGENVVRYDTTDKTFDTSRLAEIFVHSDHGWMQSPPHRANILSTDYTETGIAVYGRDGRWFATQVFGKRWWDLSELTLSVKDAGWELTGRATLLQPAQGVYVGLDDDVVESLSPTVGKPFNFAVLLPVDGKPHRFGLHPGKGDDRYWLKYLLYLDTSKAAEQALTMRFE